MKIAYLIKKPALKDNPDIARALEDIARTGVEIYSIDEGFLEGTGMMISFGGDGTFLSAARVAAPAGVPVLGVNFGRMGFLSVAKVEDLASIIRNGDYSVEERELLSISAACLPETFWPYALNEFSVSRAGIKMLGIEAVVDGQALPTYWADGLLVSTGSGSTAYNLSAGGPICLPQAKVFIVTPLAPHNLNVRPLVVPDSVKIELKAAPRSGGDVLLSADNQSVMIPAGCPLTLTKAPFTLKMVSLRNSNFIEALEDKLSWGGDIRNN